ncbi:hypothetical protein VAWG004_13210 [Aeromonas veronii]|nr:hypothetical protein VAWG004_13210 [Aeromonas veronii]
MLMALRCKACNKNGTISDGPVLVALCSVINLRQIQARMVVGIAQFGRDMAGSIAGSLSSVAASAVPWVRASA